MKTFVPKEEDIKRTWFLVDAAGKPLGRLAVQIANMLRGRNQAIYTPHVDTGHFVVVVNAEKVAVTGGKETNKTYKSYSGYRSGLSLQTLATVRARHPERILEHAVKGMLPRNNMSRNVFKRLKVYAGASHPHAAQNPITVK